VRGFAVARRARGRKCVGEDLPVGLHRAEPPRAAPLLHREQPGDPAVARGAIDGLFDEHGSFAEVGATVGAQVPGPRGPGGLVGPDDAVEALGVPERQEPVAEAGHETVPHAKVARPVGGVVARPRAALGGARRRDSHGRGFLGAASRARDGQDRAHAQAET